MKKFIILIAAFLLAFSFSYAQTEKGSQTIGVNLGFYYLKSNGVTIFPPDNSSTIENSKTTNFSIGPSYSYFIADKLDLGATLTYGANTTTNSYNPGNPMKESYYSYNGSIYLRKYFMYKNKIGIRTGVYAGYGRNDNKSTYAGPDAIYDNDSKTNSYTAGMTMELIYYPARNLGFAATLANLNYSHGSTNSGAQGHADIDGVNFNFINNGLALSVFYVFGD